MSKQSEAKEKQGYTRDIKNCGNCSHFTCDKEAFGFRMQYTKEKNLRCGIGQFKIHKTAVCDIHVLRDPT